MKRFQRWGLTRKLVVAFLCLGLIPGMAIAWRTFAAVSTMSEEGGRSYKIIAASISDKIDRNLFERYGDVQAFGLNRAVYSRDDWYKPGRAQNVIVDATNRYVKLYGLYTLSLLVDVNGRVIAVNDQDATGRDIDTAWLYEKNFADASWFKDAVAGRFLTVEGGLTGTVVQDLYPDDDVRRVFGGDGLVIGFSAPVFDADGKMLGVWNNRAGFAVVEEIVATAYRSMRDEGQDAAEFQLIDRSGRLLLDYSPARNGGKDTMVHDMSRLLKTNLAKSGVGAAQQLVSGQSGHLRTKDESSGEWQTTGFARSTGALGYAGLGWGTIVRVDERVALAGLLAVQQQIWWVMGLSLLCLIVGALTLSRSVVNPLTRSLQLLRGSSQHVTATATQVAATAQMLSQGATEQAAALEQTSASMEEMASMTRVSAANAQQAADLIDEVGGVVERSNHALTQMTESMDAIGESSSKVARIIKTIDEIAFQTNILALNAAVEAARAGEAGMGFAVVADEVRNLAQRSAQAAKDTASLIDESIANARRGHTNVGLVVESITEITVGVDKVKHLMGEVSEASRQQSQGFDQVAQAIGQMEQVTQSNAARAEESAAASEELNAEAETAMGEVGTLEATVVGAGTRLVEQHGADLPKGRVLKHTSPRRRMDMPGAATAADTQVLGHTGTEGRF